MEWISTKECAQVTTLGVSTIKRYCVRYLEGKESPVIARKTATFNGFRYEVLRESLKKLIAKKKPNEVIKSPNLVGNQAIEHIEIIPLEENKTTDLLVKMVGEYKQQLGVKDRQIDQLFQMINTKDELIQKLANQLVKILQSNLLDK